MTNTYLLTFHWFVHECVYGALCNVLSHMDTQAMINLDSVLKSRDITFPTKVHMVKAMVLCVYVFVSAYPQWPHLWLWKNDATTVESSDHSQNGDF